MSAPTDVEKRVRELLADVYTPEGVEIWLHAGNENLGKAAGWTGQPMRLLACCTDCADDVLREAERVAGAS